MTTTPHAPPAAPTRRQEQEPADPEVTEVGPGVLRMQLHIEMPGLAHINTYVILDGDGCAIVDPGLPGKPSWNSLVARLKAADIAPKRIHTIFITHSHPDHFGNAMRLAEFAGGAEIVTHRAFRHMFAENHQCVAVDCDDPLHAHPDTGQEDLPLGEGIGRKMPWAPGEWDPRAEHPEIRKHQTLELAEKGWPLPVPTRRVRNGDTIELGRRTWQAVHTPGHTLDHLCLYDREGGVFISGDHVLPTITPHVPGIGGGIDALGNFFGSLDQVGALPEVQVVLPAHGHPFGDLAGRVADIKEHHRERTVRLFDVAQAEGPVTVTEYSHHLFRKERWGAMAESETYAHLEHLRLVGRAERWHDENERMVFRIDSSL